MGDWEQIDSVGALRAVSPEAFAALDDVRVAAGRIDVEGAAAGSTAVAHYRDQLNLDVASMTPEQRAAASEALGDDLFGFLQAAWAIDMADRVDHAWAALTSIGPTGSGARLSPSDDVADPAGALWQAIDTFLPAVARLSALDPVTTEVVRLRGARAHDCRLCRSLRSVGAIDAGADEATFDAIDRFETSDLDPSLKVALRLVDALIWEPRAWPAGLAGTVSATFSPAQAVEIVLDVVRNAANKIAVALDADEANVTDGVEYFSMDETGALTYGIDRT